MTRRAFVHRLSTRSPDDVEALSDAMADGRIEAEAVVAIFGKTEGNGCVNDWTRALAARALRDCLACHLEPGAVEDICLVMSGGTEGALAPHLTVFEVRDSREDAHPAALAVGHAHGGAILPEEIGRLAQVDRVAASVRRAVENAGIKNSAEVHFVQVKCPLLTSDRVADARARGASCATQDPLRSMALSRAASSLGIAVALGEVDRDSLDEHTIASDWRFFSQRASASAGVELMGHEVVVLGTGRGWSGPLRIDHGVMADGIDVEPVRAALARVGLQSSGQLAADQTRRLVALFAKAEASSHGALRGYRHTMLGDSDISPTRHARGFTAGALAGLVGHAEIYVSGGAEHQGPDGGGPVAVIVEAEQPR